MKIAIPIKTNKDNPPLSPLFGKAKWFAIVQDSKTEIVKNEQGSGRGVVEWLYSLGIDAIIFQRVGYAPYEMIKEIGNIDMFYGGEKRILLDEALKKFKNNELDMIDDTNISTIVREHDRKHQWVVEKEKIEI